MAELWFSHHPLVNPVVIVAVRDKTLEHVWAAYIAGLPTRARDTTTYAWLEIAREYGTKLPEDVARVHFPQFNHMTYRK